MLTFKKHFFDHFLKLDYMDMDKTMTCGKNLVPMLSSCKAFEDLCVYTQSQTHTDSCPIHMCMCRHKIEHINNCPLLLVQNTGPCSSVSRSGLYLCSVLPCLLCCCFYHKLIHDFLRFVLSDVLSDCRE